MKTISMKKNQINCQQASAGGLTEGAPGTTGVSPPADGGRKNTSTPNPEVPEQKPRRKFTAAYKLRILQAADACIEPGQLGELLRQEGLYSSNLTTWRRQRQEGQLHALSSKKRGRRHQAKNPLAQRVAQLEMENQRLENKLRQAHLIIDAQKKISEILGITQNLHMNERTNS